MDDLLRSHHELRAAVRLAEKRIEQLQFGRRNADPVLVKLNEVRQAAKAIASRYQHTTTPDETDEEWS